MNFTFTFNSIIYSSFKEVRRSFYKKVYRRPWHAERKVETFWNEKELTEENKLFLKESALSQISPLQDSGNIKPIPWEPKFLRTGVLALKIGVVPQWNVEGKKFNCTLLQILDNHVIRELEDKEEERNDKPKTTTTLVVGALSAEITKFTEEYSKMFKEAGVLPKRKVSRFLVSKEAKLPPGTQLTSDHFRVGNFVDCQAKTIGHGFQGVVKRWGFKGGPASHGTTKWHRRPGNIGGGRGKSKVFKGKKMPGKMGMKWSVTRGLKIWRINHNHNVLYVHGPAVPGPINCYVRVFDTSVPYKRKIMMTNPPPFPTFIEEEKKKGEDFDDILFKLENKLNL